MLDGNFQNFHICKFQKCSGFEVRKNPNFSNLQKFCKNSSEISLEIISCFWVKKPYFKVKKSCFGVKKFGNSSETLVLGSKTGVSEHSEFMENSEFVLYQTFRKLRKMTLKSNFILKIVKNSFRLENRLKCLV